MYIKSNNETLSRNHCCSRKAVSITYSECVCVFIALVIQHANRMSGIILLSVACLAVDTMYSINAIIFGKNVSEHKMN